MISNLIRHDPAMRIFIISIILCLAFIALTLARAHRDQQASQEHKFLQWETCVLNDGPHCGPQPVP